MHQLGQQAHCLSLPPQPSALAINSLNRTGLQFPCFSHTPGSPIFINTYLQGMQIHFRRKWLSSAHGFDSRRHHHHRRGRPCLWKLKGKIHPEERGEEIPAQMSSDALLPAPPVQVTDLGLSCSCC